jgi:hypothetical protein
VLAAKLSSRPAPEAVRHLMVVRLMPPTSSTCVCPLRSPAAVRLVVGGCFAPRGVS